MEEKQASSTEVDQKNQLLPDNQAGTTSENPPTSMDDEFEACCCTVLLPMQSFVLDLIREVEFYKHNPEELTGTQHRNVNDGWYFFTQREREGENIFKRETGNGSWRPVGKEKEIVVENEGLIGYKRSLEYFSEGKRTEWLLKEYSSTLESQQPVNPQSDPKLTDTVICRFYRRPRPRGTGTIPRP
ncbi:NAC domain-containing protein 2-like [Elaeis guineensis]|uniref:NAC domain-containing protein 2-like n=1 Tax=Elaeis guineensis var. tenera TaxID=51953 RepID=UPI003C6D1197